MNRKPKVGDFIAIGSTRYGSKKYVGIVASVVAVREKSITIDARKDDRAIVIRASTYPKNDPWRYIAYVSPEEALRWREAKRKHKEWHGAIPSGAQWSMRWSRDRADVTVERPHVVDTADEAEASADIYNAVAAWLRAKPDPDELLIAVEASL